MSSFTSLSARILSSCCCIFSSRLRIFCSRSPIKLVGCSSLIPSHYWWTLWLFSQSLHRYRLHTLYPISFCADLFFLVGMVNYVLTITSCVPESTIVKSTMDSFLSWKWHPYWKYFCVSWRCMNSSSKYVFNFASCFWITIFFLRNMRDANIIIIILWCHYVFSNIALSSCHFAQILLLDLFFLIYVCFYFWHINYPWPFEY